VTSAHLDRAPSGQLAATEARQRGRKDTFSLLAAVRVESQERERLETTHSVLSPLAFAQRLAAPPSSTDFSGIRSIPDPFVLADQ
jgi:hypothetical protein